MDPNIRTCISLHYINLNFVQRFCEQQKTVGYVCVFVITLAALQAKSDYPLLLVAFRQYVLFKNPIREK